MAKTENESLAKGKDVEVYQFEDHKAHIEAHLQYMLRVDFKTKPEKVQHAFFQHYEAHKQMLSQLEGQPAQPDQMVSPSGQMPQNMVQYPMSTPQGQMSSPQGQPPMDLAAMEQMGLPNPATVLPEGTATGLAGNLQAGMTNVFNQIRGNQ
jgi:hypothetical protein